MGNKENKKNKTGRMVKSVNGCFCRDKKGFRCLGVIYKLVVTTMVLCGVMFVISINDLSIKGFILQESKMDISELQAQNEKLELQIMGLESYENIQNRAVELKMVKVDTIEYILASDGDVAKK